MTFTRRQIRTLAGATVGACFAFPTLGVAIFGQLVMPLSAELKRPPSEIGYAFSIMSAVSVILPPLAGTMIDRFGVRRVAVLSALAMTAVFVALSMASSLPALLILYGLLALAGVGTLPLAYSRPIVASFRDNLGFALGIMLSVSALAVAAAPIVVVRLIEWDGVRTALVALAGFAAAGGIAALLIGRDDVVRTNATQAEFPLKTALREAACPTGYKMLAMALLLGTFTGGVWSQVVPALSAKGFSPAIAAYAMAGVGIASAATRLIAGYALDRLFAPFVGAVVMIPVVLGWVALAYADAQWLVIAGVVVLGIGLGVEIDLFSYLTSKYMPQRVYSSFYGLLFSVTFLGAALAAPVCALATKYAGATVGVPLALGAITTAATVIMLFLPRYTLSEARDVDGIPKSTSAAA